MIAFLQAAEHVFAPPARYADLFILNVLLSTAVLAAAWALGTVCLLQVSWALGETQPFICVSNPTIGALGLAVRGLSLRRQWALQTGCADI